jgi:hypothetical protein
MYLPATHAEPLYQIERRHAVATCVGDTAFPTQVTCLCASKCALDRSDSQLANDFCEAQQLHAVAASCAAVTGTPYKALTDKGLL